MVAGKAEEDKFGKQQAWGQSTCKLLPGTAAVPLLYVDSISQGGTDHNKAAEEEPHKRAVQEARTSLERVRRGWGEAYMLRRTMAMPQQRRSPEKYIRQWGNLDPTPYSPGKPKRGLRQNPRYSVPNISMR